MSDKPKDKKAEAAPADAHGEKKKGGGIGALLTKLPVLLGGAMVIEAAVLFGAFKMLSGAAPAAAEGAALHGDAHEGDAGGEGEVVEEGAAAGGAHGEGGGEADKPKIYKKSKYPVPLIEFRAPNRMSGRQMIYDVNIEVITLGENLKKVEGKVKEQKALISDRVRTIIAQSDPEKLNGQTEPGLETLKRQVKYQLDEIVGEGMIEEVLIPRCIPFRADF